MPDWTLDDAVEEAYKDIRPLMQRHKIEWFVALPNGMIAARCACSRGTARDWESMRQHLQERITAVRGPIRKPKP